MKKNRLTDSQLREYNEKGYLAPINVLSSKKINKITTLEKIKKLQEFSAKLSEKTKVKQKSTSTKVEKKEVKK